MCGIHPRPLVLEACLNDALDVKARRQLAGGETTYGVVDIEPPDDIRLGRLDHKWAAPAIAAVAVGRHASGRAGRIQVPVGRGDLLARHPPLHLVGGGQHRVREPANW